MSDRLEVAFNMYNMYMYIERVSRRKKDLTRKYRTSDPQDMGMLFKLRHKSHVIKKIKNRYC